MFLFINFIIKTYIIKLIKFFFILFIKNRSNRFIPGFVTEPVINRLYRLPARSPKTGYPTGYKPAQPVTQPKAHNRNRLRPVTDFGPNRKRPMSTENQDIKAQICLCVKDK